MAISEDLDGGERVNVNEEISDSEGKEPILLFSGTRDDGDK